MLLRPDTFHTKTTQFARPDHICDPQSPRQKRQNGSSVNSRGLQVQRNSALRCQTRPKCKHEVQHNVCGAFQFRLDFKLIGEIGHIHHVAPWDQRRVRFENRSSSRGAKFLEHNLHDCANSTTSPLQKPPMSTATKTNRTIFPQTHRNLHTQGIQRSIQDFGT